MSCDELLQTRILNSSAYPELAAGALQLVTSGAAKRQVKRRMVGFAISPLRVLLSETSRALVPFWFNYGIILQT